MNKRNRDDDRVEDENAAQKPKNGTRKIFLLDPSSSPTSITARKDFSPILDTEEGGESDDDDELTKIMGNMQLTQRPLTLSPSAFYNAISPAGSLSPQPYIARFEPKK